MCNKGIFIHGYRVSLFSCPGMSDCLTAWTAAHEASLSLTISQCLSKFTGDAIQPSHPLMALLLLPSIFPSIWVFSNELALSIRWPNYWNFSFSTSPSNEHSGWFPLGLTGLISLQSKGLSRVFSNTAVQKNQFFSAQPSLWSHCTWLLEKTTALTNMGFPDSSVGKESTCNTGDDS